MRRIQFILRSGNGMDTWRAGKRAVQWEISTNASPRVLSYRELDILRLLEDRLSNRQMSERLIITLATGNQHMHNICRKLTAGTRTRVLANARRLTLI
jgi:ATP/maltotriose-dependent transcriptional regulator MalT